MDQSSHNENNQQSPQAKPALKNLKVIIGVAVPIVLLAVLAIASIFPTASNQGFAPEQPIPFSHKKHAGLYKIQCMYCHVGVEKSRHATVPAVSVCMNCHRVVKTESPYVQTIKKHFDEGKPIEWVRVHEVPDYVYFPHKRHVAKNISCETCHGDVKSMDLVYQTAPMTMGWCVDCHKGISTPKNVLEQIRGEQVSRNENPHGPVASLNCTTCHN